MSPQTSLGSDIFNCGSTSAVTLDAGAGYSSYLWSTGATTQTISATTGDYWVSVSNNNGCTDYDRISVTLDPGLNSVFTNNPAQFYVGDTVVFTSTTVDAIEWCWNWGDGSNDCPIQSTASHVFTAPGTYNVCLTTGNGVCVDTTCIQFVVDTLVAIDPRTAFSQFTVAPVPATDRIQVSLTNDFVGQVSLSLIDIAGRSLMKVNLDKNAATVSQSLDLSGIPAGLYLLEAKGTFGSETRKLLKH
ncbi:MAG: T9SS type A sorting domain-containing protein [Bacteroidia bacterium]